MKLILSDIHNGTPCWTIVVLKMIGLRCDPDMLPAVHGPAVFVPHIIPVCPSDWWFLLLYQVHFYGVLCCSYCYTVFHIGGGGGGAGFSTGGGGEGPVLQF